MASDPTFVAFLVGAIGALAVFVAWLLRDYLADLKKQRDEAMAGWRGQQTATERLADLLEQKARR